MELVSPRETPAVDGQRIYLAYADPAHTYLIALDHDGNEKWRRDFGPWVSAHGFGMSPLVFAGKVIFCNSQQSERLRRGQQPGKSELIAVDCETGKDVWRTPLTTNRACYSVPCVLTDKERSYLVGCSLGEGFYAIDPADGSLKNSERVFSMRTVASPVVFEDLVFGSNGSGGGGNYLVAHQFSDGKFKQAFEVRRNANYVSTPIAVGGLLFLFGDKGVASCVDARTGELHWRQRLSRGFSGSPVSNGSHVYIADSEGRVLVLQAKSEFKQVSSISLGEPTRATPAIADDRIFFRTESQIFALGKSR